MPDSIETGLLFALGLLLLPRVFCLGGPPPGRALIAGVLLALPLGVACLVPERGLPSFPIQVLLIALGLPLSLLSLRGFLRVSAPVGKFAVLFSWIVAALLSLFAFSATSNYWDRSQRLVQEEEAEAMDLPLPGPRDIPESTRLDAGNAIVLGENYRDLDLRVTFQLDPGAILEIRLRAQTGGQSPNGIGLYLSADERFPTGFRLQTTTRFVPLGSGAPVLEPGRSYEVMVTVRGHRLVAVMNGVVLADAETRIHASGDVVLTAVKGAAEVSGLSVQAISTAGNPPSRSVERWVASVLPLFFIILFSLLLRRFLPISMGRAAEVSAFGVAPLSLALWSLSPVGSFDVLTVVNALGLGSLLLLLFALVHSQALTGARYALLFAVILYFDGIAYVELKERAHDPEDFATSNALTVADWSGERLEEDFLHFQHPLLRRWNTYLVKHQFRLRDHELRKDPGTTRILCVGTSSTHGYWLKLPWGFRLELLLTEEGRDAEVMIAAVPGGSGPRLYHFVRGALLPFKPDILILNLFYNDSHFLSQVDEASYLREVTASDFERGWLDRIRESMLMSLGKGRLKQYLNSADDPVALDELAGPDSSPPDRFEQSLRDFALLARAEGFSLVLVKEPLKNDMKWLWKDEYYEAIDRVAAEFDLKVVDPREALRAGGGGELFMDNIHPLEEGAQIIAESILPAVREIMDDRN